MSSATTAAEADPVNAAIHPRPRRWYGRRVDAETGRFRQLMAKISTIAGFGETVSEIVERASHVASMNFPSPSARVPVRAAARAAPVPRRRTSGRLSRWRSAGSASTNLPRRRTIGRFGVGEGLQLDGRRAAGRQ